MRQHTATAVAWLAIALTLLAIPSLPRVVPSANAVVGPVVTPWRPYGPYVREVLVTVFTNEISELVAFKAGQLDFFDWIIQPAQIPILSPEPDALVSQPVSETGRTFFTFNHKYPIFGVTMQEPAGPCSADPRDPRYNGLFGSCSSQRTTAAGREVKKALAHTVDKAGFVNTTPQCIGGRCVSIDDEITAAVCSENAAPCGTLAARVDADDDYGPAHGTPACSTSRTPCAYNVGPGLGNGYPGGYCAATPGCWGGNAPPSGTDVRAAWEHLKAAGILDADNDGLLDFPATGQTIFAIRSDDTRRRDMGIIMADVVDSLFEKGTLGQPVVFRLFGNVLLGNIVFFSVPSADWGVYTGAFSGSLDPGHLFPLFDSAFASDFCGGTQSLFNLNYGFYCNNAFDIAVEKGTFDALTLAAFNAPHQHAFNIAADDLASMPMFSRASRTLHHSGWDGVVAVKGDGFANTFNWFNARAKPGYTGQFNGVGGNFDSSVYRAGFRQGTSRLNIFHAGTVWESHVIFNILDGLIDENPRAAANPFFDQYKTGATLLTEAFNTYGADQLPGNADDAPVTVLDIVMRNDLFFHDGVQVTFDDFVKTGLALRDVPQGGFGGQAVWAPLLAWSDPIPGSNCAPFCGRLVLDGQTFLHKLQIGGTPILPLHLWDSNGDGFICSTLSIGSCSGLPADPTTDVNYDPMANRIMVGHGPWKCLGRGPDGVRGTVDDTVGGFCSETFQGVDGGQAIGPGGRFIFIRNNNHILCCPKETDTPLHRFAQADVDKDWKITVADYALAAGNPVLQELIAAQIDFTLGGTQGKNLHEADLTNNGNSFPIA